MSPLRARMIEDMTLAGLAAGTQKIYIQSVRRLATHYRRSPDQLSEEEVRAYLLGLRQGGAARGTFKTSQYGLRFLYSHTLERVWGLFGEKRSLPRVRGGCLSRRRRIRSGICSALSATMPWKYPPGVERKCFAGLAETIPIAIAPARGPWRDKPRPTVTATRQARHAASRRRRQPLARPGVATSATAAATAPASSARRSTAAARCHCPSAAGPAAAPPLPCLLCLLSDVGPGGRIALAYVLRAGLGGSF
jgi:hypothetical protein